MTTNTTDTTSLTAFDSETIQAAMLEILKSADVTEFKLSSNFTNDLKLEILAEEQGIDLGQIFCRQTGQPIAKLASETVAKLLDFHGVKMLSEIGQYFHLATSVHPLWKNLNPETLTRLQAVDPRAFFSYCINIFIRDHHMKFTQHGKKIFETIEIENCFFKSLIECYAQTATLPEIAIENANKILRTILNFNIHKTHFKYIAWHSLNADQLKTIEHVEPEQTYNPYPYSKPDVVAKYLGLNKKQPERDEIEYKNIKKFFNNPAMLKGLKELEIAHTNGIRTIVFPHEFASVKGINWITNYLGKMLQGLRALIEKNEYRSMNEARSSIFSYSTQFDPTTASINKAIYEFNRSGIKTLVQHKPADLQAKLDEIEKLRANDAKFILTSAPKTPSIVGASILARLKGNK